MGDYFIEFLVTTVKLFALMTPPAVLSAFLSGTKHYDEERKRKTAVKTSVVVFIIGIILFFIGNTLFSVFGFTLDAFRIGAGALLFLTAVSLMNDSPDKNKIQEEDDISVVPLAVPLCMGPASIGTIIVMGTGTIGLAPNIIGTLALLVASLGICVMLLTAQTIARVLKKSGIAILSKLTGLLISAIAAQVIFTGIVAFLRPAVL
ncbi:MarC family protein [Orbaceae bacterium ESL0727]|nr:MarC family protein [Orbaceae bacterium ESL0727]